jgi:pimeloyl-ACP methyl ester carboxylesterase
MEQLGYIPAADGSALYVAYHAPQGPADGKLPLVVATALFEERKSAYGALRRLAQRLARAGHAVLRFDYRGSGESGGACVARRWEHLAQDLAAARQALSGLCGRRDAGVVGLRMGATLALHETAQMDVQTVIAIAPVVKGATQVRLWKMRSKIRSELTQAAASGEAIQQMDAQAGTAALLDFDGFDVHPQFFGDVASIDLLKEARELPYPARIVQISHRNDAAPESARLRATLGPRAALDCLRMEAFWDKLDDVDTRPLEELVLKHLSEMAPHD